MSFKVVKNELGQVIASGPNEDWYEAVGIVEIVDELPVIEPTPAEQLAQLDTRNELTQRNLREFILLTVQAVKTLNPALDLSQIPGVAHVERVEAEAAVLRAQL